MKIDKYVKDKNGMYKLILDNDDILLVHEDLILKYELLLKKEMDDSLREKIEKENLIYTAYNISIKYLNTKARSEKEIYEYLNKRQVDENIIKECIALLKKNNYINDELYSNANKVLTTNSTLSSSNLNNNSVTFNGASASLGSSGTITPELVVDGNTIKSKVGNQTSTGITVPFATTAGTCTGNADTATRLAGNDTYTAWGRTYWENGQPKTIDGNLNNVDKIYF